jgi:uncharacterized membrane protein HdeD (DUF308 family)
MIANVLNTLLGLALVYCAVLSPSTLAGSPWGMLVTGVAVIVLALWARTTDAIKWFNTTNVVLGALLLILGAARTATELHPLLTFWSVFWIGSIVSVFAFWSALYKPGPGDKPSGDAVRGSAASGG